MSDLHFLQQLNGPQREAVVHVHGPLLLVAGAGSGKTRVLTYRIAHLLGAGHARPSQILALTFTNKAAAEMKERIGHLIGTDARHLWMGTFHSIFSRILRVEAEHLGYTRDFSIYDTDDSDKVVKGILQELKLDAKEVKPSQIRFRISGAKNRMVGPEEYATEFIGSTLDDIAAQVYPIYLARLKERNAMDFDDLLLKPIELFEARPDILEQYQDRFRFILIDEYQDTNKAQYVVTRMLGSKHHNVCVVGDDAQSIYSFRGADITNILNFQADYPDATRIALEQNYRSTKAILRCADSIIKRNTKQLDKTLWTENPVGNPIVTFETFTEREEAYKVADTIRQLKLRDGYRNTDIAILYRTNHQSRVFEDALRRADITYQLVGGVSFYQRKEVKDVTAYLRLLINPADEEALLRVINEPARGIGGKSLETLVELARGHRTSLWEVLHQPGQLESVYKPAQARIREFTEIIRETAGKLQAGGSIVDTARFLLEKTGYVRQFVEENTAESLGRRENVMELLNSIAYFERSNEQPTLSGFLQEVSLLSDVDNMDTDKPAVTLMTVHAAKGLEFPVVFVVGLEEELFPIGGRNGEEADIEEERRLFYVAVTRARKELFFSHARTRFRYGEEKTMLRSRFLDEVDPAVIRSESGATLRQRSDTIRQTPSGNRIEYDTPSRSVRPPVAPRPPASNTRVEYDLAEPGQLVPGAKVQHETFGSGKIIAREGQGSDTNVTVFFAAHGTKKLLLRFAKLRLLPFLLLALLAGNLMAQPTFSPRMTAMGGAATAVAEGVPAAYLNPANLMIRNHAQGFMLYAGQASFSWSDGLLAGAAGTEAGDMTWTFRPWTDRAPAYLTADTDAAILAERYPGGAGTAVSHSTFDHLAFGMSWTGPNLGWALGWRIRGTNTWETGRAWYEGPAAAAATDASLKQRTAVWHEVSLGLAWEYTLISGWLTNLSKLFVGVNPKFIIPGAYVDRSLVSVYGMGAGGPIHTGAYSQLSSGPTRPTSLQEWLTPTGFGAGMDIGATYIIGLGNEQSLGSARRRPTRNSIRISAALTDLGFVSHTAAPMRLTTDTLRTDATWSRQGSGEFYGAPGQFDAFVSAQPVESGLIATADTGATSPINLQMPTRFQTGVALQLNRMLLSADMAMPLTEDGIRGSQRYLRAGAEIKLLRVLPVRAGLVLRDGDPLTYTAGFGLDLRHLELAIGTQWTASDPIGVAVGGLVLRF